MTPNRPPSPSSRGKATPLWPLLGYFPKRRLTRSSWVSPFPEHPEAPFPAPLPVQELCSVSECIARGPAPADSVGANLFGGFRSPTAAWDAVPAAQRSAFQLLAYRLGPSLFAHGKEGSLDRPAVTAQALPESFVRLGFDAVQWSEGHCLGCSPLSCNGQAGRYPVNAHCLVDTKAEAFRLARDFSLGKAEPGPYVVIEVWRERSHESLP